MRGKMKSGLGLAGLSLVAALLVSGSLFAQEADGGSEVPLSGGEDGVPIEDGLVVVDPICLACTGEETGGGTGAGEGSDDGWEDGGWEDGGWEDGGWEDGGWVEGDDIVGGDGTDVEWVDGDGIAVEIEPGDVVCDDAGACTDPLAAEADFNPEVYSMTGYNTVQRGDQGRSTHRGGQSARRGPDLCLSPAAEVVWLCELVNGKSE